LKLTGQILGGAGFKVLTATNGYEGLKVFEEFHENISVLIAEAVNEALCKWLRPTEKPLLVFA
jgi:hypothetical protein